MAAEEQFILIQQAATGDKQARASLCKQYSRLVWSILGKFDNLSWTEREDLSQEVFVILLDKGLRSFRGTTVYQFLAYLKMIAVNEAKSYLRRHGRRFEVLDPFLSGVGEEDELPPLGPILPDPASGPEEQAAQQEKLRGVLRCVQELPLVDQEIFWLEFRGHAYKEMTRMLGISQGAIAGKYYRAKTKIQECLKEAGLL